MKEQALPGGTLQQFQACVEDQEPDDEILFQGIELKGRSAAGKFGNNVVIKQEIGKTVATVKELRTRFDNLLGAKYYITDFSIVLQLESACRVEIYDRSIVYRRIF